MGFLAHQLPLAVALNRIRLGYGVQALRQTKYIRFRSYRQILALFNMKEPVEPENIGIFCWFFFISLLSRANDNIKDTIIKILENL